MKEPIISRLNEVRTLANPKLSSKKYISIYSAQFNLPETRYMCYLNATEYRQNPLSNHDIEPSHTPLSIGYFPPLFTRCSMRRDAMRRETGQAIMKLVRR